MYGHTFRVFVSSTFHGLVAERNALSRWVFPKLRALCEARGYKFQAVDLRWGVRDEAAVDQQTMRICLDEIARCQKLSPKPNFIVLLGDRYGWCPLPTLIAEADWNAMEPHFDADAAELKFWYKLDENAVPAEYVLQPRRDGHQVSEVWEPIEQRLLEALVRAAETAGVSAEKRQLHRASATELEIIEGALKVGNAREHVFAFVREITNCDEVERSLPPTVGEKKALTSAVKRAEAASKTKAVVPPALAALDLLDTAAAPGTEKDGDRAPLVWDQVAWNAQDQLEALLADRLSKANVWRYKAAWKDGALDLASVTSDLPPGATPPLQVPDAASGDRAVLRKAWEQLSCAIAAEAHTALPDTPNLCEAVWQRLSRVLVTEMEALDAAGGDSLAFEKRVHAEFARKRVEGFSGREAPLAAIARYLEDDAPRPLVLYGESGSGKSALMARAAELAHAAHPKAAVIERFIGVVPGASEARPLLESLCRELSHTFGDERAIDPNYDKLISDFPRCLALARAGKPVVLFLDALDQLGDTDDGRRLAWLPRELPPHVRVVVSTLRENQYLCFPVLSARAEPQDLVELAKMSVEQGEEALDTWLQKLPNPRKLTATQRREVLERFQQNGLPLYLRLAFEEARCWHYYAHVPDSGRAPNGGLARDVPGLIRALFARLKRRHGELVTSRALGLLAAARDGLSDDEMLALLWRDGEVRGDFDRSKYHDLPEGDAALPPVVWSRLYFDLEPYLAHREVYGVGMLAFYHRQLAEVAAEEYVADRKPRTHRQLADYFAERWQVPDTHALLELPYHQTKAGSFPSALTQLSFIEAKSNAAMTLELIDDFAIARRDIGPDIPAEDRRRLEEFSSFVTRNRIVLAEMPDLTFQQAANEAPETTPAMAARSLWASRSEQRPWLKVERRDGSSTDAVASVRGSKALSGATVSADGKRMVLRDGDVRVFDVQSNRELLRHLARHGHDITAAALSADGQQLAQVESASGESATCSVWSIENGAQLAFGKISLDHVSTIRFDAQGDLLLGGRRASGGGLVRWNRSRATESWSQSVPSAVIGHISEQDEIIVVAQGDGFCSVRHLRDGSLLDSRRLHSGPINAVGVSPSGNLVVTGGADHKCVVWSVGAGRERSSTFRRFARDVFGSRLRVFARHRAAVTAVTLLDEEWVASGDAEGMLWVWNVDDEREACFVLAGQGTIVALETTGDRRSLLAAFSTERTAHLFDASSLAVQATGRRSTPSLVAFGGAAGTLLAARCDGRLERLLITDQRQSQSWEELDSLPDALLWAISPGNDSVLVVNHDSTWRVRDLVSNATFSGRFKVPVREGALAAISPDGRQIAVYYQERIAVASHQGTQRLYQLPMIAKAMRFDADGALRIVGFSTRLQDRPRDTVSVASIERGAPHPGFSGPLDSKVQQTDSSAITMADGFLIAGCTASGRGLLEIWKLGVDCASQPFDALVRLHAASVDAAWSVLSCPASSVCHVVDVASLSSRWKYPLKRALVSAAIRADGKRIGFGFAGGEVEIVEALA